MSRWRNLLFFLLIFTFKSLVADPLSGACRSLGCGLQPNSTARSCIELEAIRCQTLKEAKNCPQFFENFASLKPYETKCDEASLCQSLTAELKGLTEQDSCLRGLSTGVLDALIAAVESIWTTAMSLPQLYYFLQSSFSDEVRANANRIREFYKLCSQGEAGKIASALVITEDNRVDISPNLGPNLQKLSCNEILEKTNAYRKSVQTVQSLRGSRLSSQLSDQDDPGVSDLARISFCLNPKGRLLALCYYYANKTTSFGLLFSPVLFSALKEMRVPRAVGSTVRTSEEIPSPASSPGAARVGLDFVSQYDHFNQHVLPFKGKIVRTMKKLDEKLNENSSRYTKAEKQLAVDEVVNLLSKISDRGEGAIQYEGLSKWERGLVSKKEFKVLRERSSKFSTYFADPGHFLEIKSQILAQYEYGRTSGLISFKVSKAKEPGAKAYEIERNIGGKKERYTLIACEQIVPKTVCDAVGKVVTFYPECGPQVWAMDIANNLKYLQENGINSTTQSLGFKTCL